MRIFHFCHCYLAQTETFIHRLVEKSRQSAEVTVFTFNTSNLNQFYPNGTGSLRVVKLPHYKWHRSSPRGLLRYAHQLATGIYWQKIMRAAIAREKPDLVHCHFGTMGTTFMDFVSRQRFEVKYVVSFYGCDASVDVMNNAAYVKALGNLWQSASGFLVEGPALGKKLIALGAPAKKVQLCPLIVPLQDYPVKGQYPNLNNQIRFLLIGRFVEKKGFHIFLECLGKVKRQLPDFTVSIVGDGPLKAEYLEIIKKYQYEDSVRFLGLRPHAECISLMVGHDLLVQPSLTARDGDSEGGAPTVLIEAEAVGIPVIASNHADIPFVMGYHDLLMLEGYPPTLEKILLDLPKRTDWQALAERGRRKVQRQHDALASPSPYLPFLN